MIRHGYAATNELKLHYAASGPEDGHLLLFLHGYPEFWYAWRHQLADLGDAYHCVAPDLPGYNLSSKPVEVARYRTKRLIQDVAAFAAQFSRKRKFTLVAHDWGGALAWAFAIKHPELLERLIIINAVHRGGDDAAGDDAGRYGGGGAPDRRALPGAGGAVRATAADGPRDSDRGG